MEDCYKKKVIKTTVREGNLIITKRPEYMTPHANIMFANLVEFNEGRKIYPDAPMWRRGSLIPLEADLIGIWLYDWSDKDSCVLINNKKTIIQDEFYELLIPTTREEYAKSLERNKK